MKTVFQLEAHNACQTDRSSGLERWRKLAPMKERRRHPRLPVRYHGTFTTVQRAAGEGIVLDLSLGGCRVESSRNVLKGTELTLRISLPNQVTPLAVDRAMVRWGHGQQFGLCFLSLRPEEESRLRRLVA